MPYNVPDDQKSTFNQKVKSSLGLLAADVGRTLGQLKVLQPETLVEEYQKPIEPQVIETTVPSEDGIAPIVSEYQTPVREDIMTVTPYQQMAMDAVSSETDSLRDENGEIVSSPMDVFSKPLDANRVKALGLVDRDGKPTEKGELFYNLTEAGMFDVSGKITDKGVAYLTPTEELGNPENLKAFQTLWDDQVIRPSASLGEITAGTVGFLQDAALGGAKRIGQEAQSIWHNSQTWSSLLGQTDRRPKELRDKMTASGLGLVEGAVENLSGWAGMAGTGAAWIGKKLYDVLPVGMEDEAEQAMYAARQRQWQTQQDIANLEAGEIAETVLGLDNAVKEAEAAKSSMGEKSFNEQYKQAGAFSQIAADPTNFVPAAIAMKASRMAPLANRLSITAQKRMAQVAAQDLAIAEGRTAIEAANAVLTKEAATVSIANRLSSDISSRVGANPDMVMRANQASQVASRITQSAEQIRSALPSVTAELEGLVAKRNSLATRIPEAYAQKVLQTMEVGRQVRSMPAKAVGATLERVGDALSKTDDAVTNFLKDRGLDQMYTAAVGAAGIAGMAGSPVIGAVAAGAATLKAGKVLSSYGKLFRYVGKEMENVRGQIPFWKRVASHTAPNSLGRGIAHSFNMLDLGGVTSDVLRRTGRGIAAAAPTDLMFEYLSDGADMRPETLYQAAAESLVIGGSFAAAGGAFMGTEKRMRELSNGDQLNFKRDLVDPRQKALFESIPSGTRRAIATYSIANPTLNYQFKDSGASQYDPNTNTATINVKSTNPIKALVAHETLHHTIIKNNMESGISALFLGDMKENTVGGLFRSRDGKLDPNFEAFKDAYYKRLGVAEMSNAERDAIYPLDKVAVEYFIEKHSDQYSAMAESGELGAIASSGAARRKLGSILETILPRVPVLRDLHFKSGGMIDKNGSWVTGNGILDAEGIKTDPITNKMFRDMNRRSAGLATGQFEPLISDKADSGASIILNPSDSIDSELLHPLVKTDENGKPILENGRAVALDKATELERALAGLTVNEVLRRKRSENYVPEKGEAYIDDNNQFQSGWLPDDVVSEMFAKNRFNPEQKRIIREMNRLVKKGTGDRVVMINFPATTRNKSGKAVYKPQGATLRDTVPVAILTSKDGNLLFGLMSVTKLQENIQKRSQSARGKRLYSGNVDLILRDTQAMMDFHKNGVDSIEYFSEKYGAVEADQRKKFINTMFGLLNQKEQAVLNPMLLEDGVKSKDNVYRTYRADRVSKAVPMSPQDYPAMPFSYKATSQVLLPEQARKMPEAVDNDQFYSQLERVVIDKIPSRATPQQIMATIDPTRGSGVKADEIKWSGIEQAMESLKKDGKVSKEDLLNYLRDEGQVKFKEITIGDKPPRWKVSDANMTEYYDSEEQANEAAEEWRYNLRPEMDTREIVSVTEGWNIEKTEDNEWGIFDSNNNQVSNFDNKEAANQEFNGLSNLYAIKPLYDDYWVADPNDSFESEQEAEDARNSEDKEELYSYVTVSEDDSGNDPNAAKFSEYVLPNGENYREVVLAMPNKAKARNMNEAFEMWKADARSGKRGSYTEAEIQGMRLDDVRENLISDYLSDPKPDYTSSHFPDVPNYVAHMRTNERVDSSGKKGLFVEEFQSDRHQEGRKKGYKEDTFPEDIERAKKDKEDAEEKLQLREYAIREENEFPVSLKDIISSGRKSEYDLIRDADSARKKLKTIVDQARQKYATLVSTSQVADAPFRTTWPLQLFKRALRDAVDSKKDWIGWTDGETQNERFDLSKSVEKLYWYPDGDGNGILIASSKEQGDIINERIAEDKIEDYVGKEVARRLLDAKPSEKDSPHRLSGVDLKIGGSGMKGFYDNILPKEIGKYVKQWGGKVEKSSIASGEANIPSWDRWHKETYGQEVDATIDDATLDARYEEWTNLRDTPKTVSIWKVEITPEMRKVTQTGQARFMPESANPVPTDNKFLSLADSGKQMLAGSSNEVKSGSILGTFRFMPEGENERIMESFPVDESVKKKMEGKVGFAFASDWSDSNRLYRTRNGRPIDILMGGVGYSYHPDIIGKGAWAGSFSNLTNRVLKKINQTDGIGLVVAGGRDSTISSRSFSLAFMEELRDDLINKTISRPVLNDIIRDSAERILGRKDIKSFADYDKLLHVENNAGGLTFEERFFMIKAIGSQANKKAFGLLNWNDVLKKYEMQNGKFEAGQIMSVVQFKKDAPLARASDIRAREHKSYEAVIQGRPLGMLTEKVMIGDFFKDFFEAEGTQPASYTRKVQTKMPSFKYGTGSAVFPKSSPGLISSVAKMK